MDPGLRDLGLDIELRTLFIQLLNDLIRSASSHWVKSARNLSRRWLNSDCNWLPILPSGVYVFGFRISKLD